MGKENRQVLISANCVGVMGEPRDLAKIWDKSALNKVEMIAWRGRMEGLLREARDSGYGVVSFHGRMGGFKEGDSTSDSLKLALTQAMIVPTPQLVANYGKEYEILVHAPHLRDKRNIRALTGKKDLKGVWVENHHAGNAGINEAIDRVRELRTNGVPAGVMFDMCHFIGGIFLNSNNFSNLWEYTLQFLQDELTTLTDSRGQPIPVGIHLPVGTDPGDSLPIDQRISNCMLLDFATIINKGGVERLVLESQPSDLRNVIGLKPNSTTQQRRRHDIIYDRLVKTGIA